MTPVLPAYVRAGLSDAEIADELGVSPRTVRRWRAAAGLSSSWTPTPPQHGTPARYRRGCRCTPCRGAQAARQGTYRRRLAYAAWRAGKGPRSA